MTSVGRSSPAPILGSNYVDKGTILPVTSESEIEATKSTRKEKPAFSLLQILEKIGYGRNRKQNSIPQQL